MFVHRDPLSSFSCPHIKFLVQLHSFGVFVVCTPLFARHYWGGWDSLSSHVTDFRYWDTPPLFYGVFVGFRLAFRQAQPLALEPLLHLAHECLAAEGPAGVGALAQRQKLRGVFFAAM